MGLFPQKRRMSAADALWALLPLFATILWLLLLMGALIFPNLLVSLVSAETAAGQLLHICRLWYGVLLLALLAGFPIILLAGYLASGRLLHRGIGILTAICLFFPCLFSYGILFMEELPAKYLQAGEDLSQIDVSFLVQAEVWISPKARPARLPGPYSGSLTAQPTTRYGIIGDDTGGQWVQVYIPNAMGFSLDQDRLYDENQSIQWNLEHAQRYWVSYTSNFHLVVEVTPIES